MKWLREMGLKEGGIGVFEPKYGSVMFFHRARAGFICLWGRG